VLLQSHAGKHSLKEAVGRASRGFVGCMPHVADGMSAHMVHFPVFSSGVDQDNTPERALIIAPEDGLALPGH
jgi:hypothetical protein